MSQSNVGYPSLYEGGDQRHYSKKEVHEENRTHPNVNTEGYLHKEGVMNELHEADTNRIVSDRMRHEPGFVATMHGNKPSRGAEIDAELAREDVERVEKKKGKTDSMPGKKMEHNTSKSEWKQQIDREEEEEALSKHSNR